MITSIDRNIDGVRVKIGSIKPSQREEGYWNVVKRGGVGIWTPNITGFMKYFWRHYCTQKYRKLTCYVPVPVLIPIYTLHIRWHFIPIVPYINLSCRKIWGNWWTLNHKIVPVKRRTCKIQKKTNFLVRWSDFDPDFGGFPLTVWPRPSNHR